MSELNAGEFSLLADSNGVLIPESDLRVDLNDRGFRYADGLFETALVVHGAPTFWNWRLERLEAGLRFLRFDGEWIHDLIQNHLLKRVQRLAQANQLGNQPGILKIQITRGVGQRGYGIPQQCVPWTLIQLRSVAQNLSELIKKGNQPIRIGILPQALPERDPFRIHKLLNKIASILAKSHADEQGLDDALMQDASGRLLETSGGNLFWWENGILCTPPLEDGVLNGVTRRKCLEIAKSAGYSTLETSPDLDRLLQSQGVACSSSIQGWVDVVEIEKTAIPIPDSSIQIRELYWNSISKQNSTNF